MITYIVFELKNDREIAAVFFDEKSARDFCEKPTDKTYYYESHEATPDPAIWEKIRKLINMSDTSQHDLYDEIYDYFNPKGDK